MSKPLKIAVWYNLPSGGSKRALYDQIRGLQERGHTLEAWRPQVPQQEFCAIETLVPEHEIPVRILPEGKSYLDRIIRHVLRTRILLKSMKEHARDCASAIDRGGYDLLFANTDMFYAMPFVGRYTDLPKAVYLGEPKRLFHEALPEFVWMALEENVRNNWSPRALIRRIRDHLDIAQFRIEAREEFENAKAYDRILVNSYYSRESVLRAYGVDADVCYLGIDADRFPDLRKTRSNVVVGMGTASRTKNVALAVRSIAQLPKPRPALVWIANMVDEPYLQQVRQLAEEVGVDFQLRYHISDEEVVQILNEAALMLYTSRLEPFGLAPLEANSCGLPVVGVREGGVRETVVDGQNGILCSEDPQEIAEAVAGLLSNPLRAREMGEFGRRAVEKFWNLPASIDRIEDALLRTAARQ